jgi:hypothetical protein
MTSEQRAILTFVIIVAVIFAVAIYGYMTGAWEETPP